MSAGFTSTNLVGASTSHDLKTPRQFIYHNTADTIATMKAANYFSDPRLKVGDFIKARASNGSFECVVTATDYDAGTSTTVSLSNATNLVGSATWNPGSLADGAGETSASFTVTGAAFGDTVAVAAPYDLQGILAVGYVDAADSVKVRLQNESGSTVDLASGTWKVYVTKR